MRSIKARYAGTCKLCGGGYPAGAAISFAGEEYDRQAGRVRKLWNHTDCTSDAAHRAEVAERMAAPLTRSGYVSTWTRKGKRRP